MSTVRLVSRPAGRRSVCDSAHRCSGGDSRGCLIVDMQGILVVLVPVLLAGFALLMDRFESAILAEPEKIEA